MIIFQIILHIPIAIIIKSLLRDSLIMKSKGKENFQLKVLNR